MQMGSPMRVMRIDTVMTDPSYIRRDDYNLALGTILTKVQEATRPF